MVMRGKRRSRLPHSTVTVWSHTEAPATNANTSPATSTDLMIHRCSSPTADAEISFIMYES